MSLERKLEEVEAGEGVPLIKGVMYDMLRDGMKYFGRRTMLHLGLEPSNM